MLISHTLRGCVDWNRITRGITVCDRVTPFVGVWIETLSLHHEKGNSKSHPSWVCGLKLLRWCLLITPLCHTLRGCVDWNLQPSLCFYSNISHTLRGCVDWNMLDILINRWDISHTLRGCVDWNLSLVDMVSLLLVSHPSWVCGLKQKAATFRCDNDVTPFVGVWIETALCLHCLQLI